jgi:hypothetical protein
MRRRRPEVTIRRKAIFCATLAAFVAAAAIGIGSEQVADAAPSNASDVNTPPPFHVDIAALFHSMGR